jgi:hypothetical protein
MRAADALLLVANTTPGAEATVPGKLFEYLAVGRPVLAIAPPESSTADVLRSTGGGWLAPAEVDALSRAHRARREAEGALRRAAEQQVERRRYQAALAERQYNKVDPDNRLVAGELERRWEAALVDLRAAEEALARRDASPEPTAPFGRAMAGKVVALNGRLPALWADPATSDARCKALLRCLIEKAVIERGTHDIAAVRIVWRGGEVSELAVRRPVAGVAALTRGAEMRERVVELARRGVPDEEIAALAESGAIRALETPTREAAPVAP